MPDQTDIQRDLQTLTAEMRKLEIEYNQFFSGRLARPPWETRKRVETLIRHWDRMRIDSATDRFRFSTLQARYNSFADLWDRGLRAREEGRPGPFQRQPQTGPEKADQTAGDSDRVVHVASFKDHREEMDKLHDLYDSLMEARRDIGEKVVPFHKFANLVKDQVSQLQSTGNPEVAFRVAVKDGQVNLTARGLKGIKK